MSDRMSDHFAVTKADYQALLDRIEELERENEELREERLELDGDGHWAWVDYGFSVASHPEQPNPMVFTKAWVPLKEQQDA